MSWGIFGYGRSLLNYMMGTGPTFPAADSGSQDAVDGPRELHQQSWTHSSLSLSVSSSSSGLVSSSFMSVESTREHQDQLDRSLIKLWNTMEEHHYMNMPKLDNASRIRAWFNDPANGDFLASISKLTLEGIGLEVLPPELGKLTGLVVLNLSNNALSDIPDVLFDLRQLRNLNLCGNDLTALSPKISQLIDLEYLTLSANRLLTLPPEIGQCVQLKELFVNDNQLVSLPSQIGNLRQLDHLFLSQNKLATLPSTIIQLLQLKGLTLWGNEQLVLPDEFDYFERESKCYVDRGVQRSSISSDHLPAPVVSASSQVSQGNSEKMRTSQPTASSIELSAEAQATSRSSVASLRSSSQSSFVPEFPSKIPFNNDGGFVMPGRFFEKGYSLKDELGRTEQDRIFLRLYAAIVKAVGRKDVPTCRKIVEAGFRDFETTSVGVWPHLDGLTVMEMAEKYGNARIVDLFTRTMRDCSFNFSNNPPKVVRTPQLYKVVHVRNFYYKKS